MSWYDTKEEAEKQIPWKEKEYGTEFEVVEEFDQRLGKIYWCLRKNRG